MRWLNFSAGIITFACFCFLLSQFFWKELSVGGIILRIVFISLELGLCAINAWVFVCGEIRYRKNKKKLDEIKNMENNNDNA